MAGLVNESSPRPFADFSFLQNPIMLFLAINILFRLPFKKASLGSHFTRVKKYLLSTDGIQFHCLQNNRKLAADPIL